jgi:lysylphosphatidylglycerol synthetase-like protein (DUF2156 family)
VANGEADASTRADVRAPLELSFARPLVTGLLLLIVVAGVGAVGPAVTGLGPWRHDAPAIGIGLEAVLAGLEIALVVMARRATTPSHPARALRSALQWMIAVIMVLIGVIAIANIAAHRSGDLLQRLLVHSHRGPRRAAKATPLSHPRTADYASYVLYGLIGLIVLMALIACVVLLVRARTRVRRASGYVDEPPPGEPEELRQAIESGRAALRALDDARAAIIACYVAMERSLADRGAARGVADTPDELLARVVSARIVRGAAARRLTGLFYEARFSTHPLGRAERDAASAALDELAAELGASAEVAT